MVSFASDRTDKWQVDNMEIKYISINTTQLQLICPLRHQREAPILSRANNDVQVRLRLIRVPPHGQDGGRCTSMGKSVIVDRRAGQYARANEI